jgi:hypothetical protein
VTIGGNISVRNGDSLDYCWREAVASLLPVCDKVLICDCESTDGTKEAIEELAASNPKIMVGTYPWTDPKGDSSWWTGFLNFTREHLPTDYHIQLDADEILGDDCTTYALISEAAREGKVLLCQRWNFWRDPQHLIPPGVCCSPDVIRVAPQNLWMPSDCPDPRGEEIMRRAEPSRVQIFHYGFLRKREQFFLKAREVQRIWANGYDPRLEAAEKADGNWMQHEGVTGWENNLVPFEGRHPEIGRKWLLDRGYTL